MYPKFLISIATTDTIITSKLVYSQINIIKYNSGNYHCNLVAHTLCILCFVKKVIFIHYKLSKLIKF